VAGDDADRPTAVATMVAESEIRRMEERYALVEPFDPEGEKKRAAALAEAKRYLTAAESLFNELELKDSYASAETAAARLEQTNLAIHFGDLVKARMMKIRGLLGNSEEKAARAAADQLLAIDIRATFDPKQFPPEFLGWANTRRDELRTKSDMEIAIRAQGQVPARVYVDGIYRGIAPADVKKLAPGEHYVTLIAPGYKLKQYRARAGSSDTAEMIPGDRLVDLNRHLAAIKAGINDESRRDPALRDLGRAFGASQVLFITLSRQSKAAFAALALRLAVEDGHYLAYTEESLPDGDESRYMASAASFAERALSLDAPRVDGKAVTTRGGNKSSGFSISRRQTGFISGGAGVAFVAAGVIFGVLALGQQSQFRSTPQTSSSASQIAATGRTFALVADISYIVGAIGLGGGGYLVLTSGSEKSPSSESVEEPARPSPEPEGERPSGASSQPAPAQKPTPSMTATPPPSNAPKQASPPPAAKPAEKPAEKPPEKAPPPPKPKPSDGETFDDLRDDK
jgi:hypothetical protein